MKCPGNCVIIRWRLKNNFLMKTLINQYFNWLCGHSVELGQLNEHQIWHVDSCHICSCNWGLEIFELFPSANQEVTKSKMAPNVLFRLFLLSSATTKFSHHQHWRRSDTLSFLCKWTSQILSWSLLLFSGVRWDENDQN